MNLAFVVGCGDQYRDPAVDTKVGKLSYAGNDAVGFASALRSTCGFAPESISLFVEHDDPAVAVRSEVVTKPERRAIFAAISGHSGRGLYPSPIDLLVFFFSGHGFRSSRDAPSISSRSMPSRATRRVRRSPTPRSSTTCSRGAPSGS